MVTIKPCSRCRISPRASSGNVCNVCRRAVTKMFKERHPIRHWAADAIASHRKKKHAVLFNAKQLENFVNLVGDKCQLCGLGFAPDFWRRRSLDRKNNESILTLENVQIICTGCNSMKRSRRNDDFIAHCRRIFIHASNIPL